MMDSTDREVLVRILDGQGRILMRLDSMDVRFDNVERRLDKSDLRLDSLESGQRVIVQRLDNVEGRLDGVDRRLSSVETELQTQRTELNTHSRNIEALTTAMIQFDKTQEGLIHDVGNIQTTVGWGVGLLGLILALIAWQRPRDTTHKNEYNTSEFEFAVRRIVREMLPDLHTK